MRLRDRSDQEAWREFVKLYGPIAYRLAKKKGFDRDNAEALVQRFLVKMVQVLPTFRYDPDRGRFRKWVLTVALNEIRRSVREEVSHHRTLNAYRSALAESEGQIDAKTEEWWRSAESARMLQLAFERLQAESPPEKFAVLRALLIDDRSGDEVARSLNLPRNVVYGIKFRMLSRLREIAQSITGDWDE